MMLKGIKKKGRSKFEKTIIKNVNPMIENKFIGLLK